jgi:hypothetical protein
MNRRESGPLPLPEDARSLISRAKEEIGAPSTALEQKLEKRLVVTLGLGGGPGVGPADPGSSAPAGGKPVGPGMTSAASGAGAASLTSSGVVKTVALVAIAFGVGAAVTEVTRTILNRRSAPESQQSNPQTKAQQETRPVTENHIQSGSLAKMDAKATPEAPLQGHATLEDPLLPSDRTPLSSRGRARTRRETAGPHRAQLSLSRRPHKLSPAASPAPALDHLEPSSSVETHSTLGAERALLHEARDKLRLGQLGQANRAIEEHRQRFPQGQLVEEREALAIRVLAQLGDMPGAQLAAARFRARYPRSILLPVVEEALRTKP